VGLILGAIVWGIGVLLSLLPLDPWPAGWALILVLVEIWFTRGLHLDGLADWADSLGGFKDREKRLAIMKDVRVGAFGVVALIVVLVVKWMALEKILISGSTVWFVIVFVLSRGIMVDLIARFPYARKEEGMSGPFIEGARTRHMIISYILCLLVCIPFGPAGLAAFIAAIFFARIFGWRCNRNFGGITGDLLGTANEMAETGLLFLVALAGREIIEYTGWAWVIY
jgi:adenosylcobinamide-GDP ribazoletransferase